MSCDEMIRKKYNGSLSTSEGIPHMIRTDSLQYQCVLFMCLSIFVLSSVYGESCKMSKCILMQENEKN